MLALCFARLHETSELLSWCYETWRRRILKRNTQLVLSTWSTSNIFTRNSWRSFPQWSLSNVYRSHCWPKVNLSLLGNHTIHPIPQLVQPSGDLILRTPHLQAQVVRHPPTSRRARNEIVVDKEETVSSVSRGWQLVAATLSAQPPQKVISDGWWVISNKWWVTLDSDIIEWRKTCRSAPT